MDVRVEMYGKHFQLLLSENGQVRKQSLDELISIANDDEFRASPDFLSAAKTFVYPCLNDASEACRGSAGRLVRTLVCTGRAEDVSLVVRAVHERLFKTDLLESSAEVKLLYVQLLRDVVKHTDEQSIIPCLDDVTSVLSRSVLDPCPAVKKYSCLCAAELASAVKTRFHTVADTLVEPLLRMSNYYQWPVRYSAIQSLDFVIMYSNGKQVPDVCASLNDRLFDQNVTVRLALCRAISNWMLNLPDRYSYFPKLVPLILAALVDNHEPNRKEAEYLWEKIGNQYIRENEEQLKEKLVSDNLDHYLPNVKRPNLGCRTLVAQEILKLLPAIVRGLDNWKKDVSVKSGRLLCVVALNAESYIIQYLNQLLTAMIICCRQPNQVSTHVRNAAEIMSYFISPSIYLKFLLPALSDTEPDLGLINILAGLLKNVTQAELSTHVGSLSTLLAKPQICEVRDPVFKKYLLQVIEYMLLACKSECQEFSYELFKVYITVQSITLDQFDNHFIFKELVNMCEPKTKEQLFKIHGEKLLEELNDSCNLWLVRSSGIEVFNKIVVDAEQMIVSCYKTYLQILGKTLGNLKKDSKFLMKILIIINKSVDKNIFTDKQLWQILSGILFPVLTWRADELAESLRAASCWCALNIVEKLSCFDDTILKQSFPIFLALADDSHSETREYALDSLHFLVSAAKKLNQIDSDTINNITKVALVRLNDDPGSTRFKAIDLLKVVYAKPLPTDYIMHFEDHITQLYKTIIIFLDDEDIQQLILDLLKELSWIKPDILIKHINLDVFSHEHYAQHLMDYLSDNFNQLTLTTEL